MRPFLISRRMTSTTTLRRDDTPAAIEVPSALLIMIASPRPTPSKTWAPARRISLSYALPRNQHATSGGLWIAMCTRAGNLWTTAGKRSRRLWTAAHAILAGTASGAVENRSAHVDGRGGE